MSCRALIPIRGVIDHAHHPGRSGRQVRHLHVRSAPRLQLSGRRAPVRAADPCHRDARIASQRRCIDPRPSVGDIVTHDLVYAVRALYKRPLFAVAAVLTLALGIGANSAIFSVVHAVLLRPLPYPSPDRLMTLWSYNPRQGFDKDVSAYPNFDDWR